MSDKPASFSRNSPRAAPRRKISFPAFWLMWAATRGWVVPEVHLRACEWLEKKGRLAVFRAHRGFSKSTLLGGYNAWRFYCNPTFRILHQGESDPTTYKTSRDTQNVLNNHPLTRGMFRDGGVQEWWVNGANDPRNASMSARGILSNVTSARADECQNDDVEVPRNIQTPEAREKLRYRLGEQVHILVPGGSRLFIGTPHTHDSLYDEMEKAGADCFTVRMFDKEFRADPAETKSYRPGFHPEFIFAGIGTDAKLLREGPDWIWKNETVLFDAPPGGLLDFYSGLAWPERFDGEELLRRRRETRTINEWDSQYQLHSKPIHNTRLNPDRLIRYSVEPEFKTMNKVLTMWLGKVQIVSARAYWDCAVGSVKGDDSVLAVILDDANGSHYWHRSVALAGEFAVFSDTHNTTIEAGQVLQAAQIIKELRLPRVKVETNGVGAFVPTLLKRALKQEKVLCGVNGETVRGNKNARILSGIEGPMLSGVLWAHSSIIDGPAGKQMKEWNHKVQDQPDDHLDACSGALLESPVRIGKNLPHAEGDDWRPSAGQHEIEIEHEPL